MLFNNTPLSGSFPVLSLEINLNAVFSVTLNFFPFALIESCTCLTMIMTVTHAAVNALLRIHYKKGHFLLLNKILIVKIKKKCLK